MIQTGTAILKKDENGNRYWQTCDDSSKDGFDMNIGEYIRMYPSAYGDDYYETCSERIFKKFFKIQGEQSVIE